MCVCVCVQCLIIALFRNGGDNDKLLRPITYELLASLRSLAASTSSSSSLELLLLLICKAAVLHTRLTDYKR